MVYTYFAEPVADDVGCDKVALVQMWELEDTPAICSRIIFSL